jgi:3-deoxy-manno-octulosonate cytidylyltransferase (CMP-KDO synthetase)
MVMRVFRQVAKAHLLADVVVATDDVRIQEHVLAHGGKVVMTSDQHPSGTDRIMEVAEKMPQFDAYINIQGDEPYIDPKQIDQVAQLLMGREGDFVGTLVKQLHNLEELANPNTIKAVFAENHQAIYFSRSPIPYLREPSKLEEWLKGRGYFKHIGIYGYPKNALRRIQGMQRGQLEQAESLEQLRWMENGLPIFVGITEIETQSVDAPEDLAKLPQEK